MYTVRKFEYSDAPYFYEEFKKFFPTFEINEDEKSRLMVKSAAENIVKVDLAKYGLTSEDWGDYIISGSHHTGQFYEEYMDAYVGVEPYQNGSMIDVPVDAEAEVLPPDGKN